MRAWFIFIKKIKNSSKNYMHAVQRYLRSGFSDRWVFLGARDFERFLLTSSGSLKIFGSMYFGSVDIERYAWHLNENKLYKPALIFDEKG